jgi:hypothetical protein
LVPAALLYLPACTALAFSKETNQVLQEWKTGRHEVRLVRNQGWAGPPNYRYILYKKGIIKKKIAISYSGVSTDDDSCSVSFVPPGSFEGPETYRFDKCKTLVTKVEQR